MTEELVQGSAEWIAIRLGKATASRIADVVAKTKSGPSTSRANYAAQLIAERLTGVAGEQYVSADMRWGTEVEPEARSAYEFMRDTEIVQAGFVHHPTIEMSGASPDGLAGDAGLVQFKCPLTATHIETLTGGSISGRYITQMQWEMACAKRAWCDFASFDPRLPPSMQLFVKRIQRDDVMIAALEKEVRAFLAELDEKLDKLNRIYGAPEPLNVLAAG